MMPDLVPRSGQRDIAWPAVPDEINARMLALQFQFEQTERWPVEEIETQQFRQIEALLGFCHKSVPFWRDRLRRAGLRPGQKLTRQLWSRLPVLTPQEAQVAGAALRASAPPPDHGQVLPGGTATGHAETELTRFLSSATHLRIALWHGLDFTAKLARAQASGPHAAAGVVASPNWGPDYEAFPTGPSILFDPRQEPARQIDILCQEQAAYLVTSADNATQIARHCRDGGTTLPTLRAIVTHGAALSADTRSLCRDALGVDVIDAHEVGATGILSIRCPDHAHHHIMAETVKVEILGADGRACAPGQVGRVVVTPLHNFALPLLRHATGDYARIGAPCACGRSLPVLSRIAGHDFTPENN